MTLYVLQDVRSAADQLLAAGPGKIMKPPSTLHRIVVCVYLFLCHDDDDDDGFKINSTIFYIYLIEYIYSAYALVVVVYYARENCVFLVA